MQRLKLLLVVSVLLAYASVAGCVPGTAPSPTATPEPPAPTAVAPGPGQTIVVSSTDDDGPETLRQALLDARPGDTITFDPADFPPDNPVSIAVTSELPQLTQGHVTIDASNAGVILDGSEAGGEWTPGLRITSEGNTVRGLQIVHFSGAGIVLESGATHNTIGGDREVGAGPLGQGNLSGANSDGVALFGASDNTILGNLIGTDASGVSPLPNRGPGVVLMDGAQGNVIGPHNLLAFNGDVGIDIRTSDSTGNTITQNSIHDSGLEAIRLQAGGGFAPNPPIIVEFDLGTGSVVGTSCPSCVVEVFSDDGHDGEFFEGTATADQNGTFALSTGSPLRGPGLTATATGPDGSTGTFSAPTSGERQVVAFQEGNSHPMTYLQTARPVELAPNLIGDMFPLDRHPLTCQRAEEDWAFTHVDNLGLKWVRLSLDHIELEAAWSTGHYSQLEVNSCQDEIVSLLADNGVTILYTLVYWDEELHAENYPDYRQEEEVQRFLDYTRLIVSHFKGRIQYYEILNEAYFYVDLADYIDLIKRVVPVIHEEDPEARIVVGGASDLLAQYNVDYLFGLLESDVMPLVDGIALHPMYGSSPDYDNLRQYYYDYPAFIRSIQDTASANGFSGEYFAEEMCWRMAFNVSPYEPQVYSETVAAKYYARGIVINRGLGLYAGIGGENYDTVPEIVRVVQSLTATMAGAEPTEGPPMQIESEAPNIRSYWFSLSDGDLLLALWTDGVAVDDDPGIASTVTIPDFTVQEVTGIDILHGLRQQIVTLHEAGDLVIRDLLVKDYPVFLRFSGMPVSP
jgi:hypothetical protein